MEWDETDDETWQQIQLACDDGRSRTVLARIVGPFGVHATMHAKDAPPPYTVTHIRSGRSVGRWFTQEKALTYASALRALPVVWDVDRPDYAAFLPKIAAIQCAIAEETICQ